MGRLNKLSRVRGKSIWDVVWTIKYLKVGMRVSWEWVSWEEWIEKWMEIGEWIGIKGSGIGIKGSGFKGKDRTPRPPGIACVDYCCLCAIQDLRSMQRGLMGKLSRKGIRWIWGVVWGVRGVRGAWEGGYDCCVLWYFVESCGKLWKAVESCGKLWNLDIINVL